jgi:hypothetical protein
VLLVTSFAKELRALIDDLPEPPALKCGVVFCGS